MLLLLLVLYRALGSSTATPLVQDTFPRSGLYARGSFNGTNSTSPLLETGSVDALSCVENERSIWDILWSCLSTMFACTWASLHPNLPHPDASQWKTYRTRAHLMFWALIAPELIVLWAARQMYGAREFVKDFPGFGLTVSHGHYAQMGGFMLMEESGKRLGIAGPTIIGNLVTEGSFMYNDREITRDEVIFIMPTEREIKDRSKGDGLTKALVVGQTTWFIVQCLARWNQKLIITELELVTAAFAVLNGVIYFMWWNKPQDATTAVPIILKSTRYLEPARPIHTRINTDATLTNITKSGHEHTTNKKDFMSISVTEKFTIPPIASRPSRRKRALKRLKQLVLPLTISFWVTLPQRIRQFRNRFGSFVIEEGTFEVTVFYSYIGTLAHFTILTLSSVLGIIFGAIHVAGWHFHFATDKERFLWRICSIIITAIPIALLFRSVLRYQAFNADRRHWFDGGEIPALIVFWLVIWLMPLYILARVILLSEAFVSLRSLPGSATCHVNWVEYLPHI